MSNSFDLSLHSRRTPLPKDALPFTSEPLRLALDCKAIKFSLGFLKASQPNSNPDGGGPSCYESSRSSLDMPIEAFRSIYRPNKVDKGNGLVSKASKSKPPPVHNYSAASSDSTQALSRGRSNMRSKEQKWGNPKR
ncbi:Uncharacterized protein Fot_10837 [Forsythia ovata]|uniref:Uncharacterized protein n=1 Tax=Forsythia ovata TaxID=205694 RepID=A0ABD1WI79_9LAMI